MHGSKTMCNMCRERPELHLRKSIPPWPSSDTTLAYI